MKTSYGERDYTYGTAMLTLRTAIGLTQEGLANHLGISRQAVGRWEAGSIYPKAEHLKEMITLAVQHRVFPKGSEAEEIRALWKVARQKAILDERWLSTLLDKTVQDPDVAPASVAESANHTSATTPLAFETTGQSDDAPAIPLRPRHEDAKAPQTTGQNKRLLGIVLTLVILAIAGAGGILLLQIIPTQTPSYPGYLSGKGQLAFFDPLREANGSKWSSWSSDTGGMCQFTQRAYHVSQQPNDHFTWCSTSHLFSNFAFEVQLTITEGDCGGMLFRGDYQGHYYFFDICENGIYDVVKYVDNTTSHATLLYSGRSSAISRGLGHQNKIAVVANGNLMTFYVNEQQIDQEQDGSYTSGKISLIATPYVGGGHATDVAYSNARVWIL